MPFLGKFCQKKKKIKIATLDIILQVVWGEMVDHYRGVFITQSNINDGASPYKITSHILKFSRCSNEKDFQKLLNTIYLVISKSLNFL